MRTDEVDAEGSGEVSGADGVDEPIEAGEAVFLHNGSHTIEQISTRHECHVITEAESLHTDLLFVVASSRE